MFTLRLFKIKKHSRRVLLFKRGLPVFAFLWASLLLVWPALFAEQKEQFSVAVKSDKSMTDAKVDMEDVRFFAQDKKRQPLTVTAPKVLETDTKNQLITLYKPRATYVMSSGVEVTSQTSYGVVDQVNERMLFDDEVFSETDTGYKAVTSRIVCDNREGTVDSEAPVTINGPAGRLRADGFHITDKGNTILFTGKTDTTVVSKEGDMRIQSDEGLLVEQIPQTITAIKNVKVTQTDRTVTADEMVLFYLTKEQDPNNRILKIEAKGHVTALSKEDKVTGDYGVYDPQEGTIVMRDNVVLSQGGNQVSSQTATLNLKTGESSLTPDGQTNSPNGRIRGHLLPKELKGTIK